MSLIKRMNTKPVTGALTATMAVAAVLIFASAASAAEPWWHLTVSSRPSGLHAGVAKDEVQQITVAATGGEVTVVEHASYEAAIKGGGVGALKYVDFSYNATHEEAQSALEKLYGAGNVEVQGGPGDGTGTTPYIVTFTGEMADQSVGLMVTSFSSFLGKLEGEATAVERTVGEADGTIVLVASNLGDAPVDGAAEPVSITDHLPRGLKAVKIQGVSSRYSQGGENENFGPVRCTLSTLTCTFGNSLPVYEQIEVKVMVAVQEGVSSGETDEATVSGGKASSAMSASQRLTFGGEPAFGVQSDELTPEEEDGSIDTQAGSHPFQLTETINLNQTREGEPTVLAKDLNFNLPPGLIGNPTPFPQCTIGEFLTFVGPTNECRAESAIGVARTTINNNGQVETAQSPVFALEPEVGEPARFGFYVAVAPIVLDTSVRTGGDYGVTVAVRNINEVPGFISSQVTFWGVPGDPVHNSARGWECLDASLGYAGHTCQPAIENNPPPFLSMPTSCTGALQSDVEADPWDRPGGFETFPLTVAMQSLDGCNRLPFSPTISVSPDGQSGSTPTGLTVGIHVPQDLALNSTGLAEANVKNTTVALPVGVALNPAAADGLEACSETQVGVDSDSASSCPEASKVGKVEIKSPLLPNPLTGAVYLAAQNANPFGSLVALYIVAEDPVSGTLIKVAGEVKLDPVTGQIVGTFDNTPQLPFEDLKLEFFGGARAPLATPTSCGGYRTQASIAPWSGNSQAEASSEFQIVSGPNGSACSDPLPFAPSLTAGSTNIQSGAFSPLTTTISREDGSQNLQAVQLHMPLGLSGLLSSVKLCEESQADAGTCGPESQIGETIVSVGLGGDPFSVTGGKVYITGPYEGAPFGLSIVNPAKAGPFNLGQVVVRAKIEVDPNTTGLTITTDNTGAYKIPSILDGIPLEIKHVNVTINRPGFTFNPTSCAPQAVTGRVSSTEGSSSAVSVPFQVTNCAALKFTPRFAVSTSGKTSRAKGASLTVRVTRPSGPQSDQANFAKVKVDLPKQLPSRLSTLQKACTAATFQANPANCPAASIVGHAKVITPLLPVPVEGPAYFVSHGGESFPALIFVLQGDGVTVDVVSTTFISKAGITSATLKTLPDVPFNSFELTLPEGTYSALAANSDLCKDKLKMPTAFVAQNGMEIHQSTPIKVSGCPKHKAKQAKKTKKKTAKGK